MPRARKKKPTEPKPDSVAEILATGQVKPASEIESPSADSPPPEGSSVSLSQAAVPVVRTDSVRQLGPRKRQPGESGTIYVCPNVHITMDADSFMSDAKKPLTTAQQDRIVAAGFDDVSENQDGSLWLATKWQVKQTGTDINILAVVLDQKGERLGRAR